MSSIHFKFRSGSEYEPLFFDGHFISLKDLRDSIVTKKKMGKASDFKLEVTNSTTSKEYTNDNEMIPKNTSLIIRRVPIHYENPSSVALREKNNQKSNIERIDQLNASEEAKLDSIMKESEFSTLVPQDICKTASQKIPICFHCKQNGHVIRNCPIIQRQSFGKEPVHVYLKNSLGLEVEEKNVTKQESTSNIDQITPEYFICPLCQNIFVEAVLISCCGCSYCENCINNYLVDHNLKCPSCSKCVSLDDLVSNIQLRKSITNFTTGFKPKSIVGHNSPINTVTCEAVVSSIKQPISICPPIVTSVNNIPILNNLLTSLPFPGMSPANQSILMNPLLGVFNTLKSMNDKTNNKSIYVSAPFLTQQYGKSVVSGDRVLTRDEFYSLKGVLAKEIRRNLPDRIPSIKQQSPIKSCRSFKSGRNSKTDRSPSHSRESRHKHPRSSDRREERLHQRQDRHDRERFDSYDRRKRRRSRSISKEDDYPRHHH